MEIVVSFDFVDKFNVIHTLQDNIFISENNVKKAFNELKNGGVLFVYDSPNDTDRYIKMSSYDKTSKCLLYTRVEHNEEEKETVPYADIKKKYIGMARKESAR
jgi:dTDP-glucose pyrophosphorylase